MEEEKWYCWGAQINGTPSERTYNSYNSTRKEGVAEVVFGNGYWAENDDGLLCAHTHMREGSGGNVAGNAKAVLHIPALNCWLTPNYDRDVQIDEIDFESVKLGNPLTLWINDDDDHRSQDYSESTEDIPNAEYTYDARNSRIDGICDLLDFFPLYLDLEPFFDFVESHQALQTAYEKGDLNLYLRQDDGAINLLWTSLTRQTCSIYLNESISNCGVGLDEFVLNANVEEVDDSGILIPEKVLTLIRTNRDCGIVLVEGAVASTKPLVLELRYQDEVVIWKRELSLRVLPVESMYTTLNLRGMNVPEVSQQDRLQDVPNVVFLHGFNVSENAARGWHAEMFKRLYQSGTEMNFYGVTWLGDEALSETIGFPALHYHLNIYNAFQTAPVLAQTIAALPTSSRTVVMAHSLGNMVVSQAISRYNLQPDVYMMLNAAIPSEAFDASLQNAEANQLTLVPQDWREYNAQTYASYWSQLFSADEPQSKMTWAGLFANLSEVSPKTTFYNFYSTGDEVFELCDNIEDSVLPPQYRGILHWQFEGWWPLDLLKSLVPEATFGLYAWQKQEFLKGTHAIFGTADGGWAFAVENNFPATNLPAERLYIADEANAMITNATERLTFKTTPVFSATEEMLNPNTDLMQQEEERYQILAYRIPALSPAMGRVNVSVSKNTQTAIELKPNNEEEWRKGYVFNGQWLHSDIKNMSYNKVKHVWLRIKDFIE